jgi:hypothetical protein
MRGPIKEAAHSLNCIQLGGELILIYGLFPWLVRQLDRCSDNHLLGSK